MNYCKNEAFCAEYGQSGENKSFIAENNRQLQPSWKQPKISAIHR